MLGIKGESAALKNQYASATGDHKRAILEALGLTGDAAYLYAVIEQEQDPQIRQQAIQSLIMVDDDQLGEYLTELYQKTNDSSEKDVIAGVMLATDVNPEVIISLFDEEGDLERRQTLLSTLMAMDEVDALRRVYAKETDRETKAVIIRHLGVMDATDALMQMYQADPELVDEPAFFEAFGLTSGELNTDFLLDRFKEGDEDIRQAVLNALMMQDNVDAMVQLLKNENDHEVKKQIIRMISITDADVLLDAIED
jgi:HEAT repeat protein